MLEFVEACVSITRTPRGAAQTAVCGAAAGLWIAGKEMGAMKYRVHRFDLSMARDRGKLEQFLNSLKGKVIAIVPNVTVSFFWFHKVDFVLIVERLDEAAGAATEGV